MYLFYQGSLNFPALLLPSALLLSRLKEVSYTKDKKFKIIEQHTFMNKSQKGINEHKCWPGRPSQCGKINSF